MKQVYHVTKLCSGALNSYLLGLGRVLKNGTEYSPSHNRPEIRVTARFSIYY